MFIPVQSPPPSPRARELGHDVAEVVRRFRSRDPGLNRQEVWQAFRVAEQVLQPEFGGSATRPRAIVGVIAALVAMFLVGVIALVTAQSGPSTRTWTLLMVGGLVVVIGLTAAVVATRR